MVSDAFSAAPAADFFGGDGEMAVRMRALDWPSTSLGPPGRWPHSLKTVVRIMLSSRYAMWMGWGPDLTFFCNDAYRPTLGAKHAWALGSSARTVWAEIWPDIGPRAEKVIETGTATWDEGLLLFLERNGYPEETYHTFSYSPIPDDSGAIGGMLCVVTEDTERVIGERRLSLLRRLAADLAPARTEAELFEAVAHRVETSAEDLPFAFVYLFDATGKSARLVSASGAATGSPLAPEVIDLHGGAASPWPIHELWVAPAPPLKIVDVPAKGAVNGPAKNPVKDPARNLDPLPARPWGTPAKQAVLIPIAQQGQELPAGCLIAAISPHRPFDIAYSGFLSLFTGQIASGLASVRAYEAARRRAEELAQLDKAKTAFFSNVSHEFRTPLTLLLGPTEDALADERDATQRERLTIVRRNALRLQKLVNSLLDFSRIEAGRVQATYQPTDLAAATSELASVFRSAVEKAGMRLIVDCPDLSEPVYVDLEMWEKIVLNLLSNAFKFSFTGEIEVRLRETEDAVQLSVRDTGTGIADAQLPHIFKRFHRVEGAQARTHEGTGIGLAIVQELIKLHGGTIGVSSALGRGSTFTVAVPKGKAHLPAERLSQGRATEPVGERVLPYTQEALHWLQYDRSPAEPDREIAPVTVDHATGLSRAIDLARPRVLWADDNADMREYVRRLLARDYEVETVANGRAALAAVRRNIPELILSDVMMPELDGFGLLRELRADPHTRAIPVILLSARAGEEARVEGLSQGADDYLVKPFSARELLARVDAVLRMARIRREAEANVRTILDSITDGFVTLDRGWRFSYVNAEAERILGLSQAELLGKDFWEIYPAALGTTLETELRRAAADRVRVEFEVAYEPWQRWFANKVYPTADGGLSIYFQDITERKHAEAALRESDDRFRALADNMSQLAWMTDDAGWIFWYNRRWFEYTGTTLDEMQGWGWQKVHHPDHVQRVVEKISHCFATGEVWEDTFPLRGADGHYRWFLSRALPIRDGEGKVQRWFGTNTDITEQREAEAERKRLYDELKEADRRKDEFLATLAHELRNPLAPIRNSLHILRISAGTGPAPQRVHEMMERQVNHMVRLVDDLMEVSRITRGKIEMRKEYVDLAAVIGSAVETSRPLIEDGGHEMTIELPAKPLTLEADPVRLAQVIANLLNNAAKYTDKGGKIRLAAWHEDGYALVSVRDNGIGIPEDKLLHVFDLFNQVDETSGRSRGGLGIGLSLVRSLVQMQGGSVSGRSDGPGKGSEFVVRLPLVAVGPVGEGQDAVSRTVLASGRILVVDDNQDAAESLGMVLKFLGTEVQVVHDGPSALAAVASYRPQVVLLDIGMPGMDGHEVARRIRQQPANADIKLIALTGWGQTSDRQRSREAGFDHHLIKPVAIEALQALLNSLHPEQQTG